MLIQKCYFKWDRKLEEGKFKLDDLVSEKEMEEELLKEKENNWYVVKPRPNESIKIDQTGKIERKFLVKDSRVGKFEI